MGHLLGYARVMSVSTDEQDVALQTDALAAAGCYRVYTETASGARAERPVLSRVLEDLRSGDTLVVWRLDRIGRSMTHLLETVTELERRGVGFRSLPEQLDTSTAARTLLFHMFSAMAHFERNLIRERTMAGLAAARSRGRLGGRPSKMTPAKVRQARSMQEQGRPISEIADVLGVGRATVYRHLQPADASAT